MDMEVEGRLEACGPILIDTHSHLFVEEFGNDLPEVIERAKSAGVSKVFMPNIDTSTLDAMLNVSRQFKDYCYPMIGLHPTSVDENYKDELQKMNCMLKESHSFVAVGEVGLDLYWDQTYCKEQVYALEEQAEWALQYDLPLIIHSRNSFELLFETLKRYSNRPLKGIFHSFTGDKREAESLLSLGDFMLGVNGVVTFKNSTLREVLKDVPLHNIVLETDSPYLAPVPYRGKRNESAYIVMVMQKIAEVYGVTSAEVAEMTTKNALKVFKIKPAS